MLENFFIFGTDSGEIIQNHYNPLLVLLSYIVVTLAAYVSIDLLDQARVWKAAHKIYLTLIGSFVMGAGIWSMHFLGMLAFNLTIVHSYTVGLTILSFLIAVVFSWIVFFTITSYKVTVFRILWQSPLMGIGIAAMHYTGMSALAMDAELRYNLTDFILSLAIAILASAAAILILQNANRNHTKKNIIQIGASLCLGLAVCGMHYVGMKAAVFRPYPRCQFSTTQDHPGLIALIAIGSIGISGAFFLIKRFKREFQSTFTVNPEENNLTEETSALERLVLSKFITFIIFTVGFAIMVVFLWFIFDTSNADYTKALQRYRQNAHQEALTTKSKTEETFQDLYSTLRTISRLPGVQDYALRSGALSERDQFIVQQMVNQLSSKIFVLKVILIPKLPTDTANLDWERIPIKSLEELFGTSRVDEQGDTHYETILKLTSQLQFDPSVIRDQSYLFQAKIARFDRQQGLSIPALLSDAFPINSTPFSGQRTPNNIDLAYLYSIPIYDDGGNYSGMVSAILKQNILLYNLPPNNLLISTGLNHTHPKVLGNTEIKESLKWLMNNQPDPDLYYSEVLPLSIVDMDNDWFLGAALSNDDLNQYTLRPILYKSGFWALLVVILIGASIYAVLIVRRLYFLERHTLILENQAMKRDYSEKRAIMSVVSEQASDAIITINEVGIIQTFNPAAEKMFGYFEADIIGQKVNKLMPYDHSHRHDQYLSNYLMTGQSKILGTYRKLEAQRRDGSLFPIYLSLSEVKFEKRRIFSGFIRDITEQENQHNALLMSNQLNEAILDGSKSIILATSLEGIVEKFNHASEEFLGYTKEEVINKISFTAFINAGELNTAAQRLTVETHSLIKPTFTYFKSRLSRENSINEEWTLQRKDGSTFPVLLSMTPLFRQTEHGIPEQFGYLGIAYDITLERQYRDSLERRSDELQKLVDEQTKDLLHQINRSEVANKSKSVFLSNMSHELRTPLHAILNYAKMGIVRIEKSDLDKLKQYFVNIHTAGNRLLGLLNNLLDLSKLESGNMPFQFIKANLPEVIDYSLSELGSLIHERQLTVTFNNTLKDHQAIFDREKIIQVVVNLISNAVKFSPQGGALVLDLSDVMFGDEHLAVQFTIKDEGEGIPENELKSIFDKFAQSSKTKSGAGGTGLGLSISREIITAHHGTIWAENNETRGAKFSFILPRKIKVKSD